MVKEEEKFDTYGEIVVDDTLANQAKELLSKKYAVKLAMKTILEHSSEVELKWENFWHQLDGSYKFPHDDDKYQVWFDHWDNTLRWRRRLPEMPKMEKKGER